MSNKRLKFGGKEISKRKLCVKFFFEIDNRDLNKIEVSKGKLYDKQNNSYRYYIGYDDDVIRPIAIELSQTVGY